VYIGMPMHACQEAVQRADARPPFAFQAAVLTRDLARPMRTYQRLDPVALVINNHIAFRIDGMPFAGLSQSDLGVGDIFTPSATCRSRSSRGTDAVGTQLTASR
jgi:acyl-CoA reductase-like NAD-dependent aldehyde dehydrogenase